MAVFNCAVRSAGTAVDFYSNGFDFTRLFNTCEYTRWVPEIEVSANKSRTGYRVYYADSQECTLQYSNCQARVCFPWQMMKEGETILYLGYPFIEVQRQKNASATIHAACLAIGDRGILLLGDTGAGKTTLAMKLCHEFGARLYSNDLAVIGYDAEGLYCSGGTKFFQLRQESVCRSLPEFAHLFGQSTHDTWLHKIVVSPEKLRISTGEGTVRIGSIYKVHVDEQKSDLHVANADDLSTRLNFNENLTRYIRNVTTTMTGGNNYEALGYVPSLDQPEFYSWRKNAIKYIFEEKGVEYLSGPTSKLLRFITR